MQATIQSDPDRFLMDILTGSYPFDFEQKCERRECLFQICTLSDTNSQSPSIVLPDIFVWVFSKQCDNLPVFDVNINWPQDHWKSKNVVNNRSISCLLETGAGSLELSHILVHIQVTDVFNTQNLGLLVGIY